MADINESMENKEATINRLSIHDILNIILSNWYWFIISLLLFGAGAYAYLRYTTPLYQRTATVLVKDSRKGSGSEVTAFNDIIGGISRRSVDNELHIFQSRHLMEQVVKRYDLTTQYLSKGRVKTSDMYGRTPVVVKFLGATPQGVTSFKYNITDNGGLRLTNFTDNEDVTIECAIGDTISTPLGEITTIATPYIARYGDNEIIVRHLPLNEVTEAYRKRLKCEISDKQASVIRLTMVDNVPLRAENVINGIIDAYNVDAIKDKQAISNLTEEFINERLETLSHELNLADSDIATYKQDNRLYNIAEEAAMSAEEAKRLKREALSLEANLEMAEYIYNYLNDESRALAMIPASTITLSDASSALATQIDLYNKSLLEYQRLIAGSSESNPTIVDLRNDISNMRSAIILSLESHIEGLKLQMGHIARQQNETDRYMQSSPKREKEMLSKARQQKVKEELYIYLLTKLEENSLAGATAESNARIIDKAYGSNTPISPKRRMTIAVALILGLATPFVILYLREIMNTSVRSRRDLDEALTIPFLGDIPEHSGHLDHPIVVRDESRDAISEAFRMIRTNLSFMAVDRPIQVIMFTSSIPHSGKTFVSSNLAMTLTTSGKRVLIIDIDLRRRTLSKILGHRNDRRGLTSYLSGKITSLDGIISPSGIDENLDIIYAGPQPPNPAEMLMSSHIDDLFKELRSRYDYIILDSVPAMAVADAMIIDRLVDLTVYVIREGHLDRRHLPEIEKLYREKKFHNLSTILNGVTTRKRAYGYGYTYGYGYFAENEQNSKWSRGWNYVKNLFRRRN